MSKIATPEKISRAMSYVLRHKPEFLSLTMSEEGWVSITELAEGLSKQFEQTITLEQILHVVSVDSKQRYAVKESLIRASQGHSISVNLELIPQVPPVILFHGTVERNMTSIMSSGLKAGQRQFVHLSESKETAIAVASRYGVPVILEVTSLVASQSGIEFFKSENNVWLAAHIPVEFITKSC